MSIRLIVESGPVVPDPAHPASKMTANAMNVRCKEPPHEATGKCCRDLTCYGMDQRTIDPGRVCTTLNLPLCANMSTLSARLPCPQDDRLNKFSAIDCEGSIQSGWCAERRLTSASRVAASRLGTRGLRVDHETKESGARHIPTRG
jgi:hypothetical protein